MSAMTSQAAPPVATTTKVSKRYGAFTAVSDVSLDVRPGEIVGLLGANGAGKTTLIKMLLGLTTPTSGQVTMFGAVPSRTTRQRLGYVPQGLGLWDSLTVGENFAFAATAFDAPANGPLPRALEAARNRTVGSIGLGLQRQLAFTIALAHAPDLLVLDEPTSGVDPLSRARLWDAIHSQAESGTAVLVTTHYMQEAQQCDRLLLMSHGAAVAEGSEDDIIGDTTACEVDAPDWASVFAVLNAAGLPVTLAGRRVRIANTPSSAIEEALARAGISAHVRQVRATLEEKMTVLDHDARSLA